MFGPDGQMQSIGAGGLLPQEALPSDGGTTARAFRAAGLAALVTLPFLLLASLASGVPLAGPSVIASGYLCIAFAIASRRSRQAALLTGVVLAGLVAWSLLCFFTEAAPNSWAVSAALLAPLFAAAPALVRFTMTSDRVLCAQPDQRDADTERRAPSEVSNVSSPAADAALESGWATAEAGSPLPAARFTSAISDAVNFAAQSARSEAAARGIRIEVATEADAFVASDRQTCRRIARALLDCAMMQAAAGGCIALSARKLRGAVLVRACVRERDSAVCGPRLVQRMADARALVEAAGGTLMQQADGGEVSLSVRLIRATPECGHSRKGESSGVG
jgi:hypothetical protein